jgi:hypothetical protein
MALHNIPENLDVQQHRFKNVHCQQKHMMLTITAQTCNAHTITAQMYNAHTVFTQQSLKSTDTLTGNGIYLPFMALEASLCIHKNSPLTN